MSNHRYLLFIPLFFLFFTAKTISQPLSFLSDSVTYLWPTSASQQLSSTFAETRSAHLHAGLDIRTWGREGYRVFATRDGVVHRIAIGPYGYGNVVYLKHGDGSYSVYAHLNRFEPRLQAYADSIRMIDYTFELDRVIEEKQITYRQGDVIAYTGATGAGPPHLHFELRTPEFKPFNPLLTNLRDAVTDNIPPVFTQMGVEFLTSDSHHLTGHKIIPAQNTSSGYDFGEITANGPIGLSMNVHDRANQTPNVYAVYELMMIHDSDTLFHSKADYFSYRNAGHMFLDRSYPILAQTRRGFQRLYVVNGNTLPFYKTLTNKGILNFSEGVYPITIVAKDIYGNRQKAAVTLRFEENEERTHASHIPAYPGLSTDDNNAGFPWVGNTTISGNQLLLASSGPDAETYSRNFKPMTFHTSTAAQKKLVPGRKQTFRTPDQNLWIQFHKEALYDTLDLRMEVREAADEIHFIFEPNRLPVDGQINFNYILPEAFRNNDRLVLFTADNFRDRRFYRPSINSNGIIRASLREISDLVIKEDRMAPWVGRPRISQNLAGNHIVVIPARDGLTGIDYRKSSILVNGRRGIVEYDPDKDLLIYFHPDFRPAENNQLEFEIFDGAGNRTARTESVSYSP